MLDQEPLGFSAKAPVGLWNQRLGVDTPGVFRAALKGMLAYFTSNAPGAISAAIDTTAALKLRPLPPAELAWLLIRRSLARAMARLSVEACQGREWQREDKDQLIDMLDRALDGSEIWIDPDFFDRPADHPIVEAVHPGFCDWIASLGLNPAEANTVQQRLGPYFSFALRREWAGHAETYAPIDAELQKYENRFAGADERERAWLRHAAYLERQIHEPVFEESFGLAQIYVPLRAWYAESEGPPRREQRTAATGEVRSEERRVVVNLRRHLLRWLNRGDPKDPIRVICGGPGSGKTSFARMFAAELARGGHKVLYVPLHRLMLRDEVPDIQALLLEFLRDRDILPHDPLDGRTGERDLIIFFDGLDELAMQGQAGQELAHSFVEALRTKLDNLNDAARGRLIRAFIGGRDIAVQAARLPAGKVLHVLPYHGSEPDRFHAGQGLLRRADRGRDRWWQKFGKLIGEGYTGLPDRLQPGRLEDISAQPLLNYLLALSYRRGRLDFGRPLSRNEVYRDLLDAVYDRPWGEGDHPATRQLKREEFHALLDELGLAAWHGQGRTISETALVKACEQAGLSEQLESFKKGARAGAISLLAAFYFRQAGKIEGGERTFEFTHKSFGEYLTARRLVRWMEDIHEERERNRRNRQRGWTEEEALLKWIEVAGPSTLDHELLAFLKREVRLREAAVVEDWRQTFAELFSDQLKHSLPMHRTEIATFQEMIRQARNAEEALLAGHFSCAAVVQHISQIDWPYPGAISDLLRRLDHGQLEQRLNRSYMAWLGTRRRDNGNLSASSQSLLIVNSNFESATIRGRFLEVNIERSVLGDIHMPGVEMHGACIERSSFESAYLEGSHFEGALLSRVSLRGARMAGIALCGGYIERTDLTGADLAYADLAGTQFTRTLLRGAKLTMAHVAGASFHQTDLVGVHGLDSVVGLQEVQSWRGSKIERKWVERLGLDAEKLGLEVVDDVAEA